MVIVLLGPPGAGKGTHCKRIAEKYRLEHLSSGDILRNERASGTELGKKAQKYMDSGKLVPDQIIIQMMVGAIAASNWNCVLDGFPRTVVQAAELDKELSKKGKKIDVIVNLIVDNNVIEKRITGRRSCPVCGAVYHIETMKPKVEGYCDKCKGQKLVQRPDDTLEVLKTRLKTYHEQTAAVVGYYVNTGQELFNVDAGKSADEVAALIFEKIDSLITA
jgi:adenylate kinase